MVRKAIVATVVLAFAGVGPSVGEAAVFHEKDVQHSLAATWGSCGPGTAGQPCAYTIVFANESVYTAVTGSNGKRDCVGVSQTRGISGGNGYVDLTQPYDFTSAGTCSVAAVTIPGSLNTGTVRGDVPGQNCHVMPPDQQPTSCAPTSLRIALEWQSGGDVVRTPGIVYHQSPVAPDQRCLQHWLPYRATPLYVNNATVTGQIDGLPAPLGDLTFPGAFMGFGEVNTIGTVPFCFD
jgi:hypothetical protein